MWWPFQWLVIYVLGGLTFVPLVVVFFLGYVMTYGSVPVGEMGDPDPSKREKAALQAKAEIDSALAKAAGSRPLSGWLTVRRQFAPLNPTSSMFMPVPPTTPAPEIQAAEVDEAIREKEATDEEGKAGSGSGSSTPIPPSTYSARIAQTYRQMVEARQKKEPPPREFFFCVLKGSVLFLYENEEQSECVAAIGVDKYTVDVENKDGRFTGRDNEFFSKRNAIVLHVDESKKGEAKDGLSSLVMGMGTEDKEMESAPWYFFSKSNTKMEDWYTALGKVSALHLTTTDVFAPSDMQELVDTIDTEPDPIPLRWLNAMLGRLFFGVYRTEALEQFIIGRIMKKLVKVPRPTFLGPIVVREVNVGTFPPIFSKPMLKDLTADGTSSFEVHMNYRSRPSQPNSEVRITIATTATIPTGFKPYVVNLVLAVVIKSFEGNMVVQIKRPPSSRVWWGFTHMPKMDIEIQPIVSERRIQLGMILKAIERQLREVIAESVVAPNMDDIPFFDTRELDVRGGIYSSARKVVSSPTTNVPAGGDEPPTQPGVEIPPAAEDPQMPTLRKRAPTKSQTLDSGASEELDEGGGTLSRVETAPALKGTTTSRTWFGNSIAGSKTSLATGLKNVSQESVVTPRSRRRTTSSSNVLAPQVDVQPPRTNAPQVEARPPPPRPRSIVSTSSSSIDPGSTVALASTNASEDRSVSPSGSTNTLISSIRTRDKKALQTQVNTARDAMKKWGANWAARRATKEEEPKPKPTPVYRPPDEDELPEPLSRSAEVHMSLQERLNAAAASAQAHRPNSSISSIPAAHGSGSPTRPNGSPRKLSSTKIPLGQSPPRWNLTSGQPTTEVARADAARAESSGPKPSVGFHPEPPSAIQPAHTRRASSSNPVYTQPHAGRSMVVPRVNHKPGEVVGIGSNDTGITRRISGGEEGLDKPQHSSGDSLDSKTPAKSKRKAVPTLTRSPERIPDEHMESAPAVKPKEPMDSAGTETLIDLDAEDSKPLAEAESKPLADTTPKPILPRRPSLDSKAPPSAEDVLRTLVQRDETVRSDGANDHENSTV